MFSLIKSTVFYGTIGYLCTKPIRKWICKKPIVQTETKDGEKIIRIDTTSKETSYIQSLFTTNADSIRQSTYDTFKRNYAKFKTTDPLHIIVSTMGGSLFYSLLIANIISQHKGKVSCSIKNYAMSGGTLIALMCDKIIMESTTVMGSIDPVSYGGLFNPQLVSRIIGKRNQDSLNIYEEYIHEIANASVDSYKPILVKYLHRKYDNEKMIDNIVNALFETSKAHMDIYSPDELTFLSDRLQVVEKNDVLDI